MPPTAATTWSWAWDWWGTLVVINALNLIICMILFVRSRKAPGGPDAGYRRLMATLGLVFISVAFYRSIFISSYLEQLAWFDSILNSSLLIRFFAIFAELSFAGLIASSLLRMNKEVPDLVNQKNRFINLLQTSTPLIFFACIFIANIFATAGTITKIDVLFAIEETLWGLGFLSIVPMLLMSVVRLFSYRNTTSWAGTRPFRILTVVLAVFGIGYSLYSLFYHLPIEIWPNALAQLRMANPTPPFRFGIQAVRDAFMIVHESKDLSAWGGIAFVVWQTGYFSLCSWMVLFFMTGPRFQQSKL